MAKQSMVSISSQEDLSNWEFINQFDIEVDGDDNESIYEVESIDLVESLDSLSSSSEEDDDEKEELTNDISAHNCDADDVVECARVPDLGQNEGFHNGDLSNYADNHHKHDGFYECNDGLGLHLNGHDNDGGRQYAVDDDNDDESDDGYDMDDELVPWEVKDRFMRQRIRKSGKISFGRTARSKKSALVFTRPGCVRGKHGLGLKVY